MPTLSDDGGGINSCPGRVSQRKSCKMINVSPRSTARKHYLNQLWFVRRVVSTNNTSRLWVLSLFYFDKCVCVWVSSLCKLHLCGGIDDAIISTVFYNHLEMATLQRRQNVISCPRKHTAHIYKNVPVAI